MAAPRSYRPSPGEIPVDPGVYRFRDDVGRVIYVGKAKSLRPRLSSYFQDTAALHPRTQQMVRTGASVEWTVVRTEVEAFRAELAVCPPSERPQRLKDSARALATSYSLGLDTEACRLLLGSRQAFAQGSWTRATSMFMPDVASSALPARSGYSRRTAERRRRARGQ